jgi:hypothetical protein
MEPGEGKHLGLSVHLSGALLEEDIQPIVSGIRELIGNLDGQGFPGPRLNRSLGLREHTTRSFGEKAFESKSPGLRQALEIDRDRVLSPGLMVSKIDPREPKFRVIRPHDVGCDREDAECGDPKSMSHPKDSFQDDAGQPSLAMIAFPHRTYRSWGGIGLEESFLKSFARPFCEGGAFRWVRPWALSRASDRSCPR